MVKELSDLEDGFLNDAQSLLVSLKKIDEAELLLERLYVYARMGRDQDNANKTYQALTDRIYSLSVKVSAALSFVRPALLNKSEETLLGYLKVCPELETYRFMIEDLLRSKEHILSDKEERLLSLAGDFSDGAHDIFTMLNNADLRFCDIEHNGKTYPLTHASFMEYMMSPQRELREKRRTTLLRGI